MTPRRHLDPSPGLSIRLLCLISVAASLTVSCERRDADLKATSALREQVESVGGRLRVWIGEAESRALSFAAETADLYPDLERNAASVDPAQYVMAGTGALYRKEAQEKGVPAVFVSGVVPVDREVLLGVLGTEGLDPILTDLVESNEEIGQAYYNDKNSYNRIYPPFNVLTQYPSGMDIPAYNFYYLEDHRHNPERKAVWVKQPYVDPAGRGWMISCIAPVYHEDRLEGVCGLDITIETLVRRLDLEGEYEFILLMAGDGTVVACGQTMARIFRLPLKANHRYVDTIRADTLRPENHNLLKSTSLEIRSCVERLISGNGGEVSLLIGEERWITVSDHLPELDWWIIGVCPDQ